MKVLIVNSSDIDGGAARAAYRLHLALLQYGVDSQMLVQSKISDDYTVLAPELNCRKYLRKITKIHYMMRPFLDALSVQYYKNKLQIPFSSSVLPFSNIVKRINELNPDIVHLHWICSGMIRIEDLKKISAPIVWTLHDDWALTGGCHIKWECEKYKTACGACPRLESDNKNDLSHWIFKRKKKTYAQISNLTIIALSRWLETSIKESALLNERKVLNLPNPINTDKFKAIDKQQARALWNFSQTKKIVLFGAMNATRDPNKGFVFLKEAIRKLKTKQIELVVFGSGKPKIPENFGYKTFYTGRLHDDESLVALYSAVDVMVIPSMQEAFGQTASESLSCSTPVVAFGHSGLLDIVDHKKNGYLATPFDTSDLAKGIEWVLNFIGYDELCSNARKKVLDKFDSNLISIKYVELYKDIICN